MSIKPPTRAKVEALMKRCQIGVGGRNALDNAHSIMAECYGTLGLLMLCLEQQQAELDAEVAAERERCAAIVRAAASYGCACSDREALADAIEASGALPGLELMP